MDYSYLFMTSSTVTPSPSPSALPVQHNYSLGAFEQGILWWAVKTLFTYAVIRDVGFFLLPLLGSYVHKVIVSHTGLKTEVEELEAATEDFIGDAAASAVNAVTETIEAIKLSDPSGTLVKAGSEVAKELAAELVSEMKDAGKSILEKTLDACI